MPEDERAPHPQAELQTCLRLLKTRLDEVTDLTIVPRKTDLNALAQACAGVQVLLSRLEPVPEASNAAARFPLMNIPETLDELLLEIQLLKKRCSSRKAPTRKSLKQQGAVKWAGQKVLRQLKDVQKWLPGD